MDSAHQRAWRAIHIYYHEDSRRLLLRLIKPLVDDLESSYGIDRCFFVIYNLGGPHVRLRFGGAFEALEEAEGEIRRRCLDFFDRCPSESSVDPEDIGRINASLLSGDPYESDASVYPDNHLTSRDFEPETERYGGSKVLAASLDLFDASAGTALELLDRYRDANRGRWYSLAIRTLFSQALGLASSTEELREVLGYAQYSWAGSFPSMIEKADLSFAKQPDVYRHILCDQLESEQNSPSPLLEAALRFREETRDAKLPTSVLSSHLHMTANRLVLRNPEEVYLGRLLTLALGDLGSLDSAFPMGRPVLAGS